jgi:hypothetical protein
MASRQADGHHLGEVLDGSPLGLDGMQVPVGGLVVGRGLVHLRGAGLTRAVVHHARVQLLVEPGTGQPAPQPDLVGGDPLARLGSGGCERLGIVSYEVLGPGVPAVGHVHVAQGRQRGQLTVRGNTWSRLATNSGLGTLRPCSSSQT